MKIDASYRAEAVLRDGRRVTMRLLAPSDRDELRRSLIRLSHASRYLRFHAVGMQPTDEVMDALMDVDAVGKLAIVAVTDSHDLKSERGLGIARFARLDAEPTVAEAAVTVSDEAQGEGLGRLLLAALADAARERGIVTFRGAVLASNAPMRKLLEDAGAIVKEDGPDTLMFDVPLGSPQGDEGSKLTPLWRLLRAIAVYVAELRSTIGSG